MRTDHEFEAYCETFDLYTVPTSQYLDSQLHHDSSAWGVLPLLHPHADILAK